MLGVKFEGPVMENRIKAYVDAFQSAGIRGSLRIPGYAVSRESGVPIVIDEVWTVVFTYANEEDRHACIDIADSLDISLISGLILASSWDYENNASYEDHRKGGLCIDI